MKNRSVVGIVLLTLLPLVGMSQTNTEIYLFDCKIWFDQFSLSNPRNVTENPGFYDNQPHFMPDGDTFLYSSVGEHGTTDVIMYDIRSQEKRQLTYTPDVSEYSPTPTPDKKGFSCIILEEDGTQKLWSYFTSAPVASLVTDVERVGYHTWYDDQTLALFIVGEDNAPHSLYFNNISSGSNQKVAENVGTVLQRVPKSTDLSYVDLTRQNNFKLMSMNTSDNSSTEIVDMAGKNSQYYTWTADGILLMGDGKKLYIFDPNRDKDWRELADLSKYGLGTFSRIAVNPQVSRLAVVVNE